MNPQLTQTIIDEAPEGALYWNTLTRGYAKLDTDGCVLWFNGHGRWGSTGSIRGFTRSVFYRIDNLPDTFIPLHATSAVTAEEKQALLSPATEQTHSVGPYTVVGGVLHTDVRASDRAGIASFEPPPEVVKEPEPVRVSTLNQRLVWLHGVR